MTYIGEGLAGYDGMPCLWPDCDDRVVQDRDGVKFRHRREFYSGATLDHEPVPDLTDYVVGFALAQRQQTRSMNREWITPEERS